MKNNYYSLWLSGICILLFFVQVLVPGFTESFLLNENSWTEPWRFLTAIFLHGDLTHLLFNMFALALFGMVLESVIGSRNFLLVYFGTGILANLISVNFYDSSLGASGAIYGVLGTLIMLRPFLVVWAFGLPMPLFVAGVLWIGADTIGIFVPSNVGNIAHLSGIGLGLILGLLYRRRYKERKQMDDRLILDERRMREWEDNHL